ncbi:MAG TPA: hypothetical protein VGD37_35895 [Kofleriaceae bacterium]
MIELRRRRLSLHETQAVPVMSDPQTRTSYALAIVLALGACGASSYSVDANGSPDVHGDQDASRGDAAADDSARHGDARVPVDAMRADAAPRLDATPLDAMRADAMPIDAGGGGGGGDAGSRPGGTVACYADVTPSGTCTLPTHCCFTNYSSQHNGSCTTDACVWGTISCDGPEDCGSGQHCCAHAIMDADNVNVGYTLACQTTACGAAPVNQELCHPGAGTCPSGKSCVTALGNDNDLPRVLNICK